MDLCYITWKKLKQRTHKEIWCPKYRAYFILKLYFKKIVSKLNISKKSNVAAGIEPRTSGSFRNGANLRSSQPSAHPNKLIRFSQCWSDQLSFGVTSSVVFRASRLIFCTAQVWVDCYDYPSFMTLGLPELEGNIIVKNINVNSIMLGTHKKANKGRLHQKCLDGLTTPLQVSG